VVSRIQRFASGSLLRRSVLQNIAAELLAHPELLAAQSTGPTDAAGAGGGCATAVADDSAPDDRPDTDPDVGGADTRKGARGKAGGSGHGGAALAAAAAAAAAVVPDAACLARLLTQLRLDHPDSELDEQQLREALARMGRSGWSGWSMGWEVWADGGGGAWGAAVRCGSGGCGI
jgi:hypothetical protein